MEFDIIGLAAPQGSKKHVGHGRMVESSAKVGPWREAVRASTILAMAEKKQPMITSGPVQVRLTFRMPRPKGHFRTGTRFEELRDDAPYWHAQTPDADKLARSTLDGLVAGGLLHDDRQVAHLDVRKTWCVPGEPPQCRVNVVTMP